MNLNEKNILIVGMAKSGICAAKLCYELGGITTLYDSKAEETFLDVKEELAKYHFNYLFGSFDEALLPQFDLLVMSPGVPTNLSFVNKATQLGISVIGEIELAYAYCKSDILAITGTNGKTSTTTLVGDIISKYNKNTFVVGNIGNPFTNAVLDTVEDGMVVAEISSFQLETIKTFRPKVSAILNLTEDHLNRHKTFENYINAKLRITENQLNGDFCILNYDDLLCRDLASKINAKVLWFSMNEVVEGAYYHKGDIWLRTTDKQEMIIDMRKVSLLGTHNVENIMAAALMCLCVKVPLEIIQDTVYSFKGVEHRIEYVDEVGGVKYYNDSKATNPDAAIKGIQAMITPTILLAGGMDKGNEFDEWINAFDNKVKALIVYGETKEKIKETALRLGFSEIIVVDELDQAVCEAVKIAEKGDSVLLSPACASWDQFTSFEARGRLFKELVTKL